MKYIYVCKTEIMLTLNYHNVRYNNSNLIIIVYSQFDEHLYIYQETHTRRIKVNTLQLYLFYGLTDMRKFYCNSQTHYNTEIYG